MKAVTYRSLTLAMALCLSLGIGPAATSSSGEETPNTAQLQYTATQTYLFATLAWAQGLATLADQGISAYDPLVLNFIKVINRDIQEVEDEATKMGQADHSVERNPQIRTMRKEMLAALQGNEVLHRNVDQGKLSVEGVHAQLKHLQNAFQALSELGKAHKFTPMTTPGVNLAPRGAYGSQYQQKKQLQQR